MSLRKVLSVSAAAVLVASLLVWAGLAAATPPNMPDSPPPPGLQLAQIGLDSEGNATYGYVPIVPEEPPPKANDASVAWVQNYGDALQARLEADTPYRYWKLAPGAEGYPAKAPPLQMESVFVHVFVERPGIVTAMRDILRVVLDYDSTLNRVGFIFHVPTAMYAEACVYVSEVADVDWAKAAQELEQGQTFVNLASQGHIGIY
jgi:hypothetical protein